MGLREIDTDAIGHHEFVSWEQAKHFHDKDVGHWDTGHSVPITIFTF